MIEKEDNLLAIFEGKCYYTWDTAERYWYGKWFDPKRINTDKPSKNFRECRDTIQKLRQLNAYDRSKSAEKYFVLFLEHFGDRVRKNFPYANDHNRVMSDYNNDSNQLIPQSEKFVNTLFEKLDIKCCYYDVDITFGSYWGISMGLITAIGKLD